MTHIVIYLSLTINGNLLKYVAVTATQSLAMKALHNTTLNIHVFVVYLHCYQYIPTYQHSISEQYVSMVLITFIFLNKLFGYKLI